MGWIKVTNKLPQSYKNVLVWSTVFCDMAIGYYCSAANIWAYSILQVPDTSINYSKQKDNDISHWQLLPEPPNNGMHHDLAGPSMKANNG